MGRAAMRHIRSLVPAEHAGTRFKKSGLTHAAQQLRVGLFVIHKPLLHFDGTDTLFSLSSDRYNSRNLLKAGRRQEGYCQLAGVEVPCRRSPSSKRKKRSKWRTAPIC